jgi:Uma2 family endonuclease
VALLYPLQGHWSDADYLLLTEGSNRLVELSDGQIEVLEMPTSSHQRILLFLLDRLRALIVPAGLGEVLCSPLRVRVRPGEFREPDIVFMSSEHHSRIGEDYWEGADLVIEIVSGDAKSRRRDLEQKPLDYTLGGIPEYWIVDPVEGQITVLALDGKAYVPHGVFQRGETAVSRLLEGFSVEVNAVFDAAKA